MSNKIVIVNGPDINNRPAAPVEGLQNSLHTVGESFLDDIEEHVGYPMRDAMAGFVRSIVEKAADQAVTIIAAKDEKIALAETTMIEMHQDLNKLEADNAALTARVKELVQLLDQQLGSPCEQIAHSEQVKALETQLAAAEKIAFEHGYVLACCNIVNLHDEPTIAHDALSELGVTRQAVKAMNLSEFDMKALRKIERGSAGSPYAKAKRKIRAALEVKP